VKLERSFELRAPLERVWETLIDVERVAPCLAGAEVTEASEDGTYQGTFSVRLGPTTAAYRGELHVEEQDEAAHRMAVRATGQDKRGRGSAEATIVSTTRSEGEVTRVDVETDFTITGDLARFGHGGVIQDISNRLMKDFADCLQQRIEAPPAAEPTLLDAVIAATPEGAAMAPPRLAGRTPPPQASRSAASRSSSGR
jgi:carbon monoxide dehydrogenase subunit G